MGEGVILDRIEQEYRQDEELAAREAQFLGPPMQPNQPVSITSNQVKHVEPHPLPQQQLTHPQSQQPVILQTPTAMEVEMLKVQIAEMRVNIADLQMEQERWDCESCRMDSTPEGAALRVSYGNWN